MPRSSRGFVVLVTVLGQLATAQVAAAATPEPTSIPSDSLTQAVIDEARIFSSVGVVLVVVAFAVMLVATIVKIPALTKELGRLVAAIQDQGPKALARDGGAAGSAFPYGDLFKGMFGAVSDLIKTPVGVGMALILFSVVLLLGQSAINGGFTDTAAVASPAASAGSPSSPPSQEPTAAPSSALSIPADPSREPKLSPTPGEK